MRNTEEKHRVSGIVVERSALHMAHRAIFSTNGLGCSHRRGGQSITWFSGDCGVNRIAMT